MYSSNAEPDKQRQKCCTCKIKGFCESIDMETQKKIVRELDFCNQFKNGEKTLVISEASDKQ